MCVWGFVGSNTALFTLCVCMREEQMVILVLLARWISTSSLPMRVHSNELTTTITFWITIPLGFHCTAIKCEVLKCVGGGKMAQPECSFHLNNRKRSTAQMSSISKANTPVSNTTTWLKKPKHNKLLHGQWSSSLEAKASTETNLSDDRLPTQIIKSERSAFSGSGVMMVVLVHPCRRGAGEEDTQTKDIKCTDTFPPLSLISLWPLY